MIETANMKKIEIILSHGMLPNVHNVLKDLNIGGMSHYEIEGSGKILALLLHTPDKPHQST